MAQAMLWAALPLAATPEATVYFHLLDKVQGALFLGAAKGVQQQVDDGLTELTAVAADLGATATISLPSNAVARTLKLNSSG